MTAPDVKPRPGAAARLSRLIAFPTVSAWHTPAGGPGQHAQAVSEAFTALPEQLRQDYPLVHRHLERTTIGRSGLLYRWRGETARDPLVLMAHWDVVPAPRSEHGAEGTDGEAWDDKEDSGLGWRAAGWSVDPFAGVVDSVDGHEAVRGRGALDDKGPLLVILEAVENLIAAGFRPARDVWLSFGGDEEFGGADAAAASEVLRTTLRTELGDPTAEPWLVLDEGGAIAPQPLSYISGTCAMIGLAEKGQAQVRLTASGPGGHASSPPAGTPVPRLARALRRLESRPFAPRMTGATAAMLTALAPLASGAAGLILPAVSRSGPVAARALAALGGEPAALVRTTMAQTRLTAGGEAVNVIPSTATATLDCRVLPGQSLAELVAGIRSRIADPDVGVELVSGHGPSPESPADGDRFAALRAAVGHSWPQATAVPYLLMAATDSRSLHAWCRHVYRFAPLQMDTAQRATIHGVDEWVSTESLARGEVFHRQLITSRGGHWDGGAGGTRA